MSWSAFEWILQPQLNCSKASIDPWIELAFSSFWTWCSWASFVTPCSFGRKQCEPDSIDSWPLKWCLEWGNLDIPKRCKKKPLFWESIEKLRSNGNYFERPVGLSKVAAWLMSFPWSFWKEPHAPYSWSENLFCCGEKLTLKSRYYFPLFFFSLKIWRLGAWFSMKYDESVGKLGW